VDAPRKLSKIVIPHDEMKPLLIRLAASIVEKVPMEDEPIFLGIKRGGVPLARALKEEVQRITGYEPRLGALDINLYRDDLGHARKAPKVGPSEIPGSVDDKVVVLIDDVLHTGRTVRAAIDAIADYGRPSRIYLAVLCDRGGRELPIAADFVGREVEVEDGLHLAIEFDEAGSIEARLLFFSGQ